MSGAEEFTALLMLTLYFSPQSLLCSHVSRLCCVSRDLGRRRRALSSALLVAIIPSFPSPNPGSVSHPSRGVWVTRVQVPWWARAGSVPGEGACGRHPSRGRHGLRPGTGAVGSPSLSHPTLRRQCAFLHCS